MNIRKVQKASALGRGTAGLFVFVLLFALALSSCGNGGYEKYFSEAQTAYLSGDAETALTKLEKAVAAEPAAEAYLLMSQIYEQQGKPDMAIQVLYLGYSKTGNSDIAARLDALKLQKNGGAKTADPKTVTIGNTSVNNDANSLVLAQMGLRSEDLREIASLDQLESLSLSNNYLTDIYPLSALSDLISLQISDNRIEDLTPLRSMSKLKTLYIDGNPITDFTPLYALTGLKTLSMKNIDITETQLAELQEALPNCSIYSDKATEAIVEVTLGNQVFRSDVTDLSLGGQQLTDLSELLKCHQLSSLDLQNNSISDITPLMDLQNLACLNLAGNLITDLRPLMSLSKLSSLNAENNAVDDINVLAYLPNLEELCLGSYHYRSIAALEKLPYLRRLTLRSAELSDSDLETLSRISTLTYLDLEGNTALSANAVEKLQQALPNCEIKTSELQYTLDFGKESYRSDAQHITALSCGITDLSGIEKFSALRTLVLTNNSVSSLEPLRDLTGLEELDLYANAVSDISPLSRHGALRVLDLSFNQVHDLSPLAACSALTELHLDSNGLTDISGLSGCTGLKTLTLKNNSITDISALSSLRSLTVLDLESNDITDLTPLQNLYDLQVLYLRGNRSLKQADLQNLQNSLPECNIISDISVTREKENLRE